MINVADVIKRKGATAVTISPDTIVVDALTLMAQKNIGSVIVMDHEKYLGIMTERDYSRKVILKGKNSTTTKVSEIMSTNLPSVNMSDTIEHCMQVMTENNIRYMPVIEDEKLTGIISMSDVVRATIYAQKETINHLHTYINS